MCVCVCFCVFVCVCGGGGGVVGGGGGGVGCVEEEKLEQLRVTGTHLCFTIHKNCMFFYKY